MSHCGCLGTRPSSDGIQDIRGTTVRGADGKKFGTVNDLIFDHDTMEIRYLVVDSGSWLEGRVFLLPADRVSVDENHEDGLSTRATAREIEDSPDYDQNLEPSGAGWEKYEQEFKKHWDEEPVLHIKGSDRIITPPEEPVPNHASSSSQQSSRSAGRHITAANLFPERISEVFSDPAPSGSKVTLRPKSVARGEDAAKGASLLKPRWWDSFEDYLRLNRNDIRAQCAECKSKAA